MTAKLEAISEMDPGLKLVIQRRQVGGDIGVHMGVCAHGCVCPWVCVPMECVPRGVCSWGVPMECAHGCVLMGVCSLQCYLWGEMECFMLIVTVGSQINNIETEGCTWIYNPPMGPGL